MTVLVRAPASVANLGSGFDVLALAVDLWLEVEAEPAAEPDWTFTGEGAAFLQATPNPLSELPFRGVVRNAIPMGVGLGSSAAARVVAGALAGLDAGRAFEQACQQEGHRDNAAAAAFGGVRLCTPGHLVALPVPDAEVALLAAHEAASTEAARALLPSAVPMADAVFNLGRVGLLVDALHTGRLEQMRAAMEDRLHQPSRRPLYAWTEAAIEAALGAGAYGASISGAGPTVFALAPRGRGEAVARAMAKEAPGRGRPVVTRVAPGGVSVEQNNDTRQGVRA